MTPEGPRAARSPVLDFGNMLAGVLPTGGFAPERLQPGGDLALRFRRAFDETEARRAAGEMGFFALAGARSDDRARARELADRSREAAASLRPWCDSVVVVGIGGSALGATALRDALVAPTRPGARVADGRRKDFPRLHVLDNLDPETLAAVLDEVELERTLFNVVSKSGDTVETTAAFLVTWQRLRNAFGPEGARRRVLVTTGSAGPLRELAAELELPSLPAPDDVGGRFSVLSPVGIFPAAAAGIDVAGVLDGAAEMVRRCASPEPTRNPAGALATLCHAADAEAGARIHVLMPYADRLNSLALWFQQLWAESLGKAANRRGERVETGPTLLPALGPRDQHAQLQLFMEGPRDKVVIFLASRASERDLAVPRLFPAKPALAYLGGGTLFGVLDAERRATAEALRREGRPNMTISVDRIDARSVGGLIMLLQIATVYAGALYDVNPLDQPGVELGKALAAGLLERPGFRSPDLPAPDPRWQA